MILSRITLSPFAGIPHCDLGFADGLNVVLGANEAGKSTVFHALYNALFTEAALTPGKFKKTLARFLPVGGGDTIAVALHFKHESRDHCLKRKWGPAAGAELQLPDGNILSDESKIADYIGKCLSVSEGTCRSVLMTKQTGLAGTLAALKSEHLETVRNLGDLLKAAVLETDGVSVENFRKRLEERFNDYYDRWDPDKNRPEGGRGIEKPWKKQVGRILQVYYDRESIRVAYEGACRIEEAVDAANRKIAGAKTERDGLERYVAANKKAAEDAQERKTLQAQTENLERDIVEYKKANRDWPVREKTLRDLTDELPVQEKEVDALKQKKVQAEQTEKHRRNTERYESVSAKKRQVEAAEKNLKSIQPLTEVEVSRIDEAFKRLSLQKTELAGGKITVSFEAKNPVAVSVTKDLEETGEEHLMPGECRSFQAGGRLLLEHADWRMVIFSGEGEFAERVQKIKDAENELNTLLKKYTVASVEEAKKLHHAYEACRRALITARDSFKAELGDRTIEELEVSKKTLSELPDVGPPAEVVERLVKAEHRLEKIKSDRTAHREAIDEYVGKYGDPDSLLTTMADAIRKEKNFREKLDALAPLPEGVENAEAFIKTYRQRQEALTRLNEALKNLEIERAGIHPPDQSSEELKKQLDEMDEAYDTVLRKGKAILRVREAADEILRHLDEQGFSGLKRNIEGYIETLTDGRYRQITIDGSLPAGFVRTDGKVLDTNLLSTGTLDVLGLALRLSMADYFLKDRESFLVMDDPLVDMDFNRRSNAAKLLQDYSQRKQLIIFTCHPAHADLLGGNRIVMD